MKSRRFKFEYRKNASKLHIRVGEILRADPGFCHFNIYQEYPVNKVNPNYHVGSHRFDWVIPSLKVVIECHGRQHFEPVAFGGDVDSSIEALHSTRSRDKKKMDAALTAGFRYVVVRYDELKSVTAAIIFDKIEQATQELKVYKLERLEEANAKLATHELAKEKARTYIRNKRKEYLESDRHQEELERAREYRKKQYQLLKGLKNGPR